MNSSINSTRPTLATAAARGPPISDHCRPKQLTIVVDPGFVVDPVPYSPLDQPPSPNPPRRWDAWVEGWGSAARDG
jgi:hypothetical protein